MVYRSVIFEVNKLVTKQCFILVVYHRSLENVIDAARANYVWWYSRHNSVLQEC